MRTLSIALLVVLSLSVSGQVTGLRLGTGMNITGEESSLNHSLESLALYVEPAFSISDRTQIRYSAELGLKFTGEVVETSLPPRKYGSNWVVNQYLKYLYYPGQKGTFLGAGYLLHYQRPFDTLLDGQGGVISTQRINQVGHGASLYVGKEFSRLSLEGSYHHVFGRFNSFGAVKIGYRAF